MKTQKKLHKKINTSVNIFLEGKLKKKLARSNNNHPSQSIPQRLLMALKKTQHA